jgi:hypothetical protein
MNKIKKFLKILRKFNRKVSDYIFTAIIVFLIWKFINHFTNWEGSYILRVFLITTLIYELVYIACILIIKYIEKRELKE